MLLPSGCCSPTQVAGLHASSGPCCTSQRGQRSLSASHAWPLRLSICGEGHPLPREFSGPASSVWEPGLNRNCAGEGLLSSLAAEKGCLSQACTS